MTMLQPGRSTGLVGSFQYSSATDTLTWSDPVYAIHGFRPRDVVPSLELMLSHLHPEDRELAASLLSEVCATGLPFSLWHRIIDAQGLERQVLSVGAGVIDERGVVGGFSGYVTDVTDAVRRAVAAEVQEAVEGVSRSRPVIDQVKGALMLTYSLDADAAFALLRRYSQVANVKVRDVARQISEALASGDFPLGTRQALDRLVAEGARVSTIEEISGQAAD